MPTISGAPARDTAAFTPARTASGSSFADERMPQLDGLRCFAALAVLAQHALPSRLTRVGMNEIGVYGVWLFFTLSGFLITGILLRGRADPHTSPGLVLRRFYARRVLRIFPLYYAVVLICAGLGIAVHFRRDLPWFLTYLSNWRFMSTGVWGDAPSAPTWSLAVEEQFYLLWPTLVLFAPRAWLPRTFIGIAVAGVLSRALLAALALHHGALVSVTVPTTSNLDPLALGALLALARHAGPQAVATRHRWTRVALATGLAFLAVVLVLAHLHRGQRAMLVLETLAASLVSVWLIDHAADGFTAGSLGHRLLSPRPVRYVGMISYGVYMIHAPLAWVLRRWAHVTVGLDGSIVGMFAFLLLLFALTLALASLSWFGFEQKVLALKARFPYAGSGGECRSGAVTDVRGVKQG